MSADGLDPLLADLRRLPSGKLSCILGKLSNDEQRRVLELLERDLRPPLAFCVLASLSPWLVERVDDVAAAGLLTPSTRLALNEIVTSISAAPPVKLASTQRSLVDRLFGRQATVEAA